MIYKINPFRKELRHDFRYTQYGSTRNLSYLACFCALITFAIHLVLETMSETVLQQAFPELMRRSYFALLFTYNVVFIVLLITYYALNFRQTTFAEILQNNWYLQAKMGYSPRILVLSKLAARLVVLVFTYTMGFVAVLALGLFLKYPIVTAYLYSLFFTGLTGGFILTVLILTVSILAKGNLSSGWLAVAVGLVHVITLHLTGRYDKISSPTFMSDFRRVLDLRTSPYLQLVLSITLLCLILSYLKALTAAMHLTPEHLPRVAEGVRLLTSREPRRRIRGLQRTSPAVGGPSELYPVPTPGERAARRVRHFNTLITGVAAAAVIALLALNLLLLVFSAAQNRDMVSVRGSVPLIFGSRTMEPAIYLHDLTVFRQIDRSEVLGTGDIILFKHDGEITVERIRQIDGDRITADIDNYPDMTVPDAMLITVDRSEVLATLDWTSRWLGALIHFANTIFGRILLLLIPSILLFYHDEILRRLEQLFSRSLSPDDIREQRLILDQELSGHAKGRS